MSEPIKYIRRLTIALILSGALNIALASFLFYTQFVDTPPAPYYELAMNRRFLKGVTPSTQTESAIVPKALYIAKQAEQPPQATIAPIYKAEEPPATEKLATKEAPAAPKIVLATKQDKIVVKEPPTIKKPNPNPSLTRQEKPVAPVPAKQYTVQEGDTLWKIARKYKVDVNQIKASNRLESDTLRPGRTLKIP